MEDTEILTETAAEPAPDWSAFDGYEFQGNEIFVGDYPPQAAEWCNENGKYTIEEIEPDEDGNIRYQIKPIPAPTEEEIAEYNARLNLTGTDVERALLAAKGMDFDDVIALVEQYNEVAPLDAEGNPARVNIKALTVELKAGHFYYGNPWVKQIGALLGFTDEQMLEFFKTGDYTKLVHEE